MLLVKTKIGPSEIDGIGLFADQFIPRGTLVWELVPALDIEVAVEGLPETARAQILRYGYKDKVSGKSTSCASTTAASSTTRKGQTARSAPTQRTRLCGTSSPARS